MADVLIVGGGIIGAATAFALARRGASVEVLDRGLPSATNAAAGVMGIQMEAHEDTPLVRLCVASLARFEKWAESIAAASGVDVQYRRTGVLSVARTEEELDRIERAVAWQSRLNLRVEPLDLAGSRRIEPALATALAGAVYFPDEARVDPPSLLAGALIAGERAGVRYFANAAAKRIGIERGRAAFVELDDGTRKQADAIVVAAGSWSSLIEGTSLAEDAVRPARGQIVELGAQTPMRSIVFTPEVYLSPRDDGRVLVGSTVELVGFAAGSTAGAVQRLLAAAIAIVPSLAEARVERTWSGFRPCTADGLPLIGRTPIEGLFVATGHFRSGVMLAPITAEIMADLVTAKTGSTASLDLHPFDPARRLPSFPAGSGG